MNELGTTFTFRAVLHNNCYFLDWKLELLKNPHCKPREGPQNKGMESLSAMPLCSYTNPRGPFHWLMENMR